MVQVKDRRKNKRVNAYWVAILENNLSGFLVNLSHGGVKLWLDRGMAVNEQSFSIRIRLSYVFPETITLHLRPLWINSTKNKDYIELGCQFEDSGLEQQQIIDQLISFFDTINVKEYYN